jgi:hypothetical protein
MKKIILSFLVLLFSATSLQAQINQEKATAIVTQYVQIEVFHPYLLSVYQQALSEEGIIITSSMEETFKANMLAGHIT